MVGQISSSFGQIRKSFNWNKNWYRSIEYVNSSKELAIYIKYITYALREREREREREICKFYR